MPRYLLVLIVLSISLAGCAGWQGESKLPFPTSPKLTFVQVDARYCLARDDAKSLAIFFDQLEAFRHAHKR
jgi:hypothetical protein